MRTLKRDALRTSAAVLGVFVLLGMMPSVAAAGEYPDEWFFYPEGSETREQIDRIVGKQAPKLNLTGWINKPEESFQGKITVVDFWATWCGPCLAAIPHNNEVAEKYADQGVAVLGVCTSSGQEKFKETAEKYDIQYPAAKDPNSASAKAWNVQFYPTYAVVDRKGVVRAIGLKPTAVERVVKRLLKDQPPSDEESSSESQ